MKFVALLLFVCAAQAQINGHHRPAHVNPEASTLEFQTQDLDKVKNPVLQFASQISKIRESMHNRVPARFQEYANKGRELMQKLRERIQNMLNQAQQSSQEVTGQVPQPNGLYQVALECVKFHETDLLELSNYAQNLLQQSIKELIGDVEGDLGPLADDIQAQTDEAIRNIQQTISEVQALIAEGKLKEAKARLNEGRRNLDDEVTAIVDKVKEMQKDYPQLAEEAEELGKEFYEATLAGATNLFKTIQECVANGGPSV